MEQGSNKTKELEVCSSMFYKKINRQFKCLGKSIISNMKMYLHNIIANARLFGCEYICLKHLSLYIPTIINGKKLFEQRGKMYSIYYFFL